MVAFFFPVADLFVATQYDIPFKLSISTVHVSVMAITPAIASHTTTVFAGAFDADNPRCT